MNDHPTSRRSTSTRDEIAGTVLAGRYAIQRQIARGGMATVYLAEDTLLHRDVAVKVLSGDADPGERDSFLREARAVARLSHPNIVEVYDAGVEGSLRYIVMQYVPGSTLRDVIAREAPLDPHGAVRLTIALADALEYGHRRGVVHCDVKPGNVLLGDHNEPKIVDFGIARRLSHTVDMTETIAGTAGYISPEQIEGEPLDGRTDVYSLAAVLYEMLGGVPPHSGGSLATVAAQRLTRPPAPLRERNPAIPAELDQIVLLGLARDPADRYPSAQAFADDLRAYQGGARDGGTRRISPSVDRVTERIAPAPRRPAPALVADQAAHRAAAHRAAAPRRAGGPWLFVLLAGMLAVVLTGLIVVIAANVVDFGGGGTTATVPSVTGRRLDDAAPAIRQAGLRVGDVRIEGNPAELGTVIGQDPPAESSSKTGQRVNLVVSAGPSP